MSKCDRCGNRTGLSVCNGQVRCTRCLWAEIKRLTAIVERLPKTAEAAERE